ncbi:MAG: response regulator [Acidimicrobiia bacterium]
MPAEVRVLVVEDEESLAESIAYNLRREGFTPQIVTDGSQVLGAVRVDPPSLILLDLMLPGMNGLDVLRALRAEKSAVPVIIVTAKDTEADVVAGLELGADDYVTKPFSMRELLSRIRALLRRTRPPERRRMVLRGGPVVMDLDRHEVTVHGDPVKLRPKEFELLEALLTRKGDLVPRDVLLEEVWGYTFFEDTKTLDVHVKRLRSKIEEDPANPIHIVTVRGFGYKFVDD